MWRMPWAPLLSSFGQTLLKLLHYTDAIDVLLSRNAFNATFLWCACLILFIKNASRACSNPVFLITLPHEFVSVGHSFEEPPPPSHIWYNTYNVDVPMKGSDLFISSQMFKFKDFSHMPFSSTQSGLRRIGNGISSLHQIELCSDGFCGKDMLILI